MSGYEFTSEGTSYDDEDRLTGYARNWNLDSVLESDQGRRLVQRYRS
jgi:hypothetical protein